MRILLLYDNFVRDYRGLLLLAEFLRSMGNKVWIKAGWDDPFSFCRIHHIDTIVTGQVAESATHGYGKYCVDNNLRLVINSSEPILQEKNFSMAIVYNTHELNQDIIDMQTVGVHSLYEYILSHKEIKNSNKSKYKMLGFPRTDISYNKELRELEREKIILKYNLGKYRKKYIFLSSFLLDGAFDGVPEKDLERWNFKEFQIRTVELLSHTAAILKKFIAEYMGENDVLLIKKHPWDCSSFFAENFVSDNCIILDNTEYIIPSLSVADMVIHTHSTSAVEAWIMKKPTVAIFLEKYYDAMCVHMQYERIAHNYEDFITMLNDVDYKVTDVNAPDLFAGSFRW